MALKYSFLDSGYGQKLERFGSQTLIRPSSGAIWAPRLSQSLWDQADATFSRVEGKGWENKKPLPENWQVEIARLRFTLKRTDFGHVGLFPEHARFWSWMEEKLPLVPRKIRLLNLFAYSGGASFAAARGGAQVVHVDASKGMVAWAKENAALNGCEGKIAWIVDDVMKFLHRWVKRGEKFDAIICDPPTFGRGAKNELFKIERDCLEMLAHCCQLLVDKPLFFLLSCHTPGFTPLLLQQLLADRLPGGSIESGEMVLEGQSTYSLPSGSFALWHNF